MSRPPPGPSDGAREPSARASMPREDRAVVQARSRRRARNERVFRWITGLPVVLAVGLLGVLLFDVVTDSFSWQVVEPRGSAQSFAFGEGFATALSGMALENPIYCDTTLSSGFRINIEGHGGGTPGWFNEISVMEFIYDLWDTAIDGPDTGSIGFGPIYRVMTGAQRETPAFTSVFSFAAALKEENPANAPFIDGLLAAHDIRGEGMTAFGDGETNDGSGNPIPDVDVLPVYTNIVPDGSTTNVCSHSGHDRDGSNRLLATGNKLSQHRFLRMTIDTPARYTFAIHTTNNDLPPDDPDDPSDQSDPDIRILLNGVSQNRTVDGELQGFSGDANEEVFTTPNELAAGEYVMALVEFRYQDPETHPDYPMRTCFDVTVAPAN